MRGRDRLRGMLGRGTSVLVLSLCTLAAGAATGYAVKHTDTTSVHACYRVMKDGSPARNATLRMVASDATCRRNERALDWDLHGTAGPTGPTGATGPAGP